MSISSSGYLTNTVDRAGRVTEYTYAPTKKLTSVTQYLEQNGSNIPVRLAYDYDQQFNTLAITEPRGRYVESYQLDIQDRITSVTNIEGQVMSFDYSVGSMVTNITRFDQSRLDTSYDSAGRKSSVVYFSPGNHQRSTINYAYYADSQLKTITDGTTSVSNTYDRLNRMTEVRSQRTDVSVADSALSYGYDPVGNVTNAALSLITNNDSLITSYSYDPAERLTSISSGLSTFDYTYSPVNGRVSSITNLESGIVTIYVYDIMDRATNISYRTASGNLIRSLNYQYDALGMITNRTTEAGGRTTEVSYEYDTINRLIREDSGDSWAEYSYDLAGNRTVVRNDSTTNNYQLGTGNRLASWGTTGAAQYDTAGNTTNLVCNDDRELNLQWDERYRLSAVSSELAAVSYTYDVLGRRISRTETSNAQPQTSNSFHSIYNGNQVAADLDASGNLLRSYTWGPGIDNLLSMTVHSTTPTLPNSQTYYPLKDHQNSILAFTDASGTIVETYEYDAWGNTKVFNSSGTELSESAIGNRYTFQGREIDWATGLIYFRARWYSPETGRWLSKDPIGISGGLNLYAFCGNNPVNFVDPLGLCEESFWDRLKNNYDNTLDDLYGKDLEWADTLGLWGLGAMGINAATGVAQGIADFAAGEQIANSALAGVNQGGSMAARQAAAAKGAATAGRTAAGRAALSGVGKVTGVVTAAATGYSVGARLNAGVRAVVQTVRGQ